MKIERILIEDQMAPIGLDEKKPAFSWLLTAEEGEQNLMQSACRIVVRTACDGMRGKPRCFYNRE